jgi:hypothetical protein
MVYSSSIISDSLAGVSLEIIRHFCRLSSFLPQPALLRGDIVYLLIIS